LKGGETYEKAITFKEKEKRGGVISIRSEKESSQFSPSLYPRGGKKKVNKKEEGEGFLRLVKGCEKMSAKERRGKKSFLIPRTKKKGVSRARFLS